LGLGRSGGNSGAIAFHRSSESRGVLMPHHHHPTTGFCKALLEQIL
jgi:hypothetical protein